MDKQDLGAALLRLSLGVLLVSHGLLKVFVFTVPGTVAFFAGLGLPAIAAYLTILGELFIGLGLIAGFYSRWFALLSLPIFIGATWAHSANGWLFSNANGGWEFPLILVILALISALLGPGRLTPSKQ